MTKRKILSVFFILSIIAASTFIGIVDSINKNETWKFVKNKMQGLSSLILTDEAIAIDAKNPQPQDSVFKQSLAPILFKPTKVYSPDVPLEAVLEEIGLDENGALGTPDDWHSGGWYKNSALTGAEGNIIVDGHYDTNTGTPAAFWELKNLKLNDRVVLVDELGRNFTYKITNLVYVDIQDSNRLDILKKSEGSTLTLVTCGGVWLNNAGTYNKRLILKAQLITKTPKYDIDS